ncbi:MAG: hypothetical protein IMZ71_00195, partial [Chloroflexi bacterium]|nr:hypothetical protein [Chloroflexota bacterium]
MMSNDVDAPTPRLCRVCRDILPGYESGDVCDGCKFDAMIPDLKAFQAAEKYQWVNAFGHSNATERPQTGVE